MRKRAFGTVESRSPRPGFYIRFSWRKARYRRYAGLSRTIAHSYLARLQSLLERGATVERAFAEVFGEWSGASMTFRDSIDPYLVYAAARRKESTVRSLRQSLTMIGRAKWATKQLRGIVPAEIQAWTSDRVAAGTSGATLNRNLNAISGLYRWAMRSGYVEDNPVRRVERFSERGRERETYLTSAESRALVEACSPGVRDVVFTALHTGLRRGELLALRWKRIDLVRKEMVVEAATEKAGRGRVVPMTEALHGRLVALRGEHAPALSGDDPVFRLPDGREITAKMLRSRFETSVRRCQGIPLEKRPKVTFHCLRHTAASLMVAEGVPIFDVAKILGHSTLAVTMRYAHFAPAAARAGIEKLGRALGGGAANQSPGAGGTGAVAEATARQLDRRSA